MQTISYTEARKNFKSVLDKVTEDAEPIIITRKADDAVMMSLDYYNSLMETVHLLRSPANAAHLQRSIAQYQAGQAISQQVTLDE